LVSGSLAQRLPVRFPVLAGSRFGSRRSTSVVTCQVSVSLAGLRLGLRFLYPENTGPFSTSLAGPRPGLRSFSLRDCRFGFRSSRWYPVRLSVDSTHCCRFVVLRLSSRFPARFPFPSLSCYRCGLRLPRWSLARRPVLYISGQRLGFRFPADLRFRFPTLLALSLPLPLPVNGYQFGFRTFRRSPIRLAALSQRLSVRFPFLSLVSGSTSVPRSQRFTDSACSASLGGLHIGLRSSLSVITGPFFPLLVGLRFGRQSLFLCGHRFDFRFSRWSPVRSPALSLSLSLSAVTGSVSVPALVSSSASGPSFRGHQSGLSASFGGFRFRFSAFSPNSYRFVFRFSRWSPVPFPALSQRSLVRSRLISLISSPVLDSLPLSAYRSGVRPSR
jgi:hypothetical protein